MVAGRKTPEQRQQKHVEKKKRKENKPHLFANILNGFGRTLLMIFNPVGWLTMEITEFIAHVCRLIITLAVLFAIGYGCVTLWKRYRKPSTV
jgi:cation transport ATPase